MLTVTLMQQLRRVNFLGFFFDFLVKTSLSLCGQSVTHQKIHAIRA